MLKKLSVSLGSGLIIGSMAGNLPSFQYWCFVIGVILLNYAYFEPKHITDFIAYLRSKT
jgi:hypothetical protein